MKLRRTVCIFAALLAVSVFQLGTDRCVGSETDDNKARADSVWSTRTIEGWRVQVSQRLEHDETELLEKAVALLTLQLKEVVRVVPKSAVSELQKVTLWISPEYAGVSPRAEYHPSAGWLREHGRAPAMAKGVEFTNVRIFEAETRRMPNFALHELAHAYHDQVLGNDNAEVLAAFERAKAAGTYSRVERKDSEGRKTMELAYAMTSPQEYFAETSEAYFSKNDFQPYDREELKSFDPVVHRLLGILWKCD